MVYIQRVPKLGRMDGLPDELSADILSLLTDDCKTLHAVCLTSKTLYRIALPLLYRRFTHYLYDKPARLHGFLRAIITKSDLALNVNEIDLRDPKRGENFWDLDSWRTWARIGYNPTLTDEDQLIFSKASNVFEDTDPPYHSILLENEQAQAALLVALATNLVHLHTDNPASITDPPRFRVNNHLFHLLIPLVKSGTILHSLEHFTASDARLQGGQGGFRTSVISPFFRLPKLKRVELTMSHEPEDDEYEDFDCPAKASNVEHLTFHSSNICPKGLRQALSAIKVLRVFECEWTGRIVGWVELNFSLLRESLWKHRDTLNRMYLDTTKRHDDWPESNEGLIPPLGRLCEFSVLEDLDVPASALIGYDEEDVGDFESLKDVLPPALKKLRLNATAPRLYDQLAGLAVVCSEQAPHLKSITICDEISEETQADMVRSFVDAGTGISVIIETEAGSSVEQGSTSSQPSTNT